MTDKRGYAWHYSFDSSGNTLTAEDPYSNTTATITYNAQNFPLTATDALGNETVTTYDSHDNATQVQQKNSAGTVLVTNSYAYVKGRVKVSISATVNPPREAWNHNHRFRRRLGSVSAFRELAK